MVEEIKESLKNILTEDTSKIVLSSSKSKENIYRKINIRKTEKNYIAERYTDKQVFHLNFSFEDMFSFVCDELDKNFKQYNAWNSEYEYNVKVNKGKVFVSKKRLSSPVSNVSSHNREKNYILKPDAAILPLTDMGIFTKDGKIAAPMYDKYKQINRFIEIIDDEISKINTDKTLNIIDFGCGKSYLTFIMYHYLTKIKNLSVEMLGLDLKKDVIKHCNETAKKYGYENLRFELGDIKGYNPEKKVDIVITLHACDTATDHALFNAVKWGADMIFSVPCCQHELNSQMNGDELSILTKYGIIKERTAALFTDAIRGNLLTYCGYKTQIMEFVDLSHTPKNLLIRAVKTNIPQKAKNKALEECKELIEKFNLNPTLYKLIKGL